MEIGAKCLCANIVGEPVCPTSHTIVYNDDDFIFDDSFICSSARSLAHTHTLHPNATADMTDFDALIWLHFLQRMRYISFQSPPSAWSERTRAHTIKIKSIKGSTSSEREHSLATFMTSFFIWCSISIRTNINISFAFMVRQCSDYKKKKTQNCDTNASKSNDIETVQTHIAHISMRLKLVSVDVSLNRFFLVSTNDYSLIRHSFPSRLFFPSSYRVTKPKMKIQFTPQCCRRTLGAKSNF